MYLVDNNRRVKVPMMGSRRELLFGWQQKGPRAGRPLVKFQKQPNGRREIQAG